MTDTRHESPVTDDTERLVSAKDAAMLLGVSERTVRRRIAAGELPSIKVGQARLIPATALDMSRQDDSADTPDMTPVVTPADMSTALVDLVERQASEIARLTAELAVTQERLRALTAGQDREDAPVAAPERHHATEIPAEGDETLQPWWRRWLRW